MRVLISSQRENTTAVNEEGEGTVSLWDVTADDMHPMESNLAGSVPEEHQKQSDVVFDSTETSFETVSD